MREPASAAVYSKRSGVKSRARAGQESNEQFAPAFLEKPAFRLTPLGLMSKELEAPIRYRRKYNVPNLTLGPSRNERLHLLWQLKSEVRTRKRRADVQRAIGLAIVSVRDSSSPWQRLLGSMCTGKWTTTPRCPHVIASACAIIITVAVAIDAMTRWLASAASALPGSARNTLMLQRIWRLS